MDVIILGGSRDGEVIPIPDESTSYCFPKLTIPSYDMRTMTSPFGPAMDVERWNVGRKCHYWTHRPYYVIIEPKLETWLRKWLTNS